ncbi:ATP-dependent DNA helicase RecG [Desmospora profundinema]|uniref:ATP-dependent DNA helicase RecG n=1 Tax=Desmospora profundinema TaxID=1571184 RepID=A0ABU1IS42_9BACL|nr:ATP-dependent DNA helicase RecG [Desmospora profundinema]MDR6227253.1 ATP-dependent DNA helicase RecG [Desmospora profundinema]
MNLDVTPVTEVSGVGTKRAEDLTSLGIRTVADLLAYFPYRYEDFRVADLGEAVHEEKITLQGTLFGSPSIRWYGKKKSRLTCRMQVQGVTISLVWFNQHFLKNKLVPGQTVTVHGKWDAHRLWLTVDRAFLTPEEQQKQVGRLEPVYSVNASVTVSWLRKTIAQAFRQFGGKIREILPQALLERYQLMGRARAMVLLHFPKGREEGRQARRRMVYEELFLYELKLLWRRRQEKKEAAGIAHSIDPERLKAFVNHIPFPLTEAQRRVVNEILTDMRHPERMTRLLQGDVGSGKTVVAAIALYANYLSGYQGAMMVPTEILAEQHLKSLKEWLEPWEMTVVGLSGGMTAKERRDVMGQLQMGLADVVVGTHALIQEAVAYRNLGLVITDEQHRFGVKQRSLLREKGENPDVLYMTATPIPRTLAITAYGEMDVSTIDELPAGRLPVETYWVKRDVWPRVIQFIRKQCGEGRQAYIICPLIEESEKVDLQNAQSVFEEAAQELAPIRVGLLHGKMAAAEKEEVMKRFAANDVQVLVSTTVVEVGVNVPNATVMVVYDADRFGLAQLHQLRGRVGRGQEASTCILVANPSSETGIERMRVMTETTDGFEIAQRDLALRGPGDFFGFKQSGVPEFKVADLVEDGKVLEVARADAVRLVESDDLWVEEEYAPLRCWIQAFEKEASMMD